MIDQIAKQQIFRKLQLHPDNPQKEAEAQHKLFLLESAGIFCGWRFLWKSHGPICLDLWEDFTEFRTHPISYQEPSKLTQTQKQKIRLVQDLKILIPNVQLTENKQYRLMAAICYIEQNKTQFGIHPQGHTPPVIQQYMPKAEPKEIQQIWEWFAGQLPRT